MQPGLVWHAFHISRQKSSDVSEQLRGCGFKTKVFKRIDPCRFSCQFVSTKEIFPSRQISESQIPKDSAALLCAQGGIFKVAQKGIEALSSSSGSIMLRFSILLAMRLCLSYVFALIPALQHKKRMFPQPSNPLPNHSVTSALHISIGIV